MTDNYKKTTGDDEYQFPHDEYVSVDHPHDDQPVEADHPFAEESKYSPTSTKSETLLERFPILRNKRVFMAIGIAVVAIIAFKILSPSHDVKIVKKQSVVNTQSAAQQSAREMMLNKLGRLSKDAASNHSTVCQLQSQISGLKSSLESANSNSVAMKNAVVALAQQVQNLQDQMKKDNVKPKKRSPYPPPPVITYHLRAAIPGRAWVMGSNGISNTIVVGSKLKYYGVIRAIDSHTGKVLTSSGKTITYDSDGD